MHTLIIKLGATGDVVRLSRCLNIPRSSGICATIPKFEKQTRPLASIMPEARDASMWHGH
jgi:hypothetical protein